MDLVKDWHKSEIALDIYKELLKEQGDVKIFKVKLEVLYRRRFVEWIIEEAEQTMGKRAPAKLDSATTQLAVYLFDLFLNTPNRPSPNLHELAAVCLMVAAKVEDNKDNAPRPRYLNALLCHQGLGRPTPQKLCMLERQLLTLVDWRLMLPNPAHFLPFFLKAADADAQVEQIAWNCLHLTLLDGFFRELRPAQMACICVAMGRFQCGLRPTWPIHLLTCTGYSQPDVSIGFFNLHALLNEEPAAPKIVRPMEIVEEVTGLVRIPNNLRWEEGLRRLNGQTNKRPAAQEPETGGPRKRLVRERDPNGWTTGVVGFPPQRQLLQAPGGRKILKLAPEKKS